MSNKPVNIIVVGGPSRVGKTTLCRHLLVRPELSGFDTLRWDAFKYTMAKSFGIEEADLYTFEQLGDDTLEAEAHRDEIVFEAMRPYISWQLENGLDMLMEGRFRAGFDWSFLDEVERDYKLTELHLTRTPKDIDSEIASLKEIEASDPQGGWILDAGWTWEAFARHHIAGVLSMQQEARENGKMLFDVAEWGSFEAMLEMAEKYVLSRLRPPAITLSQFLGEPPQPAR